VNIQRKPIKPRMRPVDNGWLCHGHGIRVLSTCGMAAFHGWVKQHRRDARAARVTGVRP
jgi:hypothetical protein